MPLVAGADLVARAHAGRYAVGAFNLQLLDLIPTVIHAAVAESAPVILQLTVSSLDFLGWENAAGLARQAAAGAPVPIAIQFDHGPSFDTALRAIRLGFTAVMIDGSAQLPAANTALTRQVAEAARAAGVSVEAEIGHVAGAEDATGGAALYTDPDVAGRFARETGCDYLAVAFGTAHGHYRRAPELDFDRLRAIAEQVQVPLVMHGGSGVPDPQVQRAVELGVGKVNFSTELKDAWVSTLRQVLSDQPAESDPRRLLAAPREAVMTVVRQKMRLCGCAGRA